ncbi:MAG TPA: preprotein translocase subunit YajC [Candidatus Polarisedimenticolia bacterium]|nr:preprotein translocase subunit YajC [Candidatus Polarisedimenticolia bacterium]
MMNLAQAAAQSQGSSWLQIAPPLLVMAVIFYFLLILPERRRRKETQQMQETLKTGDRVVTSMGLVGTVVKIDRNLVQLRLAEKVKVDFTRSSIVSRQEGESAPSAET